MDQGLDCEFVVILTVPLAESTTESEYLVTKGMVMDRYYITESAIAEFHPSMIIQWTPSEMTVVSDNGSYQVIRYRELLS